MSGRARSLRELRAAAGLTERELARSLAVTPGRITNWEHGWVVPDARQVGLLALVLGVGEAEVRAALPEMRTKG